MCRNFYLLEEAISLVETFSNQNRFQKDVFGPLACEVGLLYSLH